MEILLTLPLIFLANLIEAQGTPGQKRAFNWLLLLSNLPLFLLGLALVLRPDMETEQLAFQELFQNPWAAGVILLGATVWAMLVCLPETRRRLNRWLHLDPASPVHTLALMLAGYLVAFSLLPQTQGGLEALAETSTAASLTDVLSSQFLYALLGIAGVGLFVRRRGWKLLNRLGLERPTEKQLSSNLRWVPVLILLQFVAGILFALTDPEQAEMMQSLNMILLGEFDTLWEWFMLAAAAGIGEEILFRGALQPVLGLWGTAFLFAFAHVQYGLTLATLVIFLIGLLLGIIRRRSNTTVAIVVHFAYNFILGLLSLLGAALQ